VGNRELRNGQELNKILLYHQNKLKYFQDVKKQFKNTDNTLKIGRYKGFYDKTVRMYRQKIKFHTEAVNTLNEVMK